MPRVPAEPLRPWQNVELARVEKWMVPELLRECMEDLQTRNNPTPKQFHDWLVWLIDNRPAYTP